MSALPIKMREHGKVWAGLLLVAIALVVLTSFRQEIQQHYLHVLSHAQDNALKSYAFFLGAFLFAALTSTFPLSLICVLAGVFFGLLKGFLLTALGIVVAGALAFAISRYFFRATCLRLAGRVLDVDRIERHIVTEGWRYAVLIRLAPVAPFGLVSYGLGLTSIRPFHYALCTLASFPFLFACVYVGTIGDFVITSGNTLNSQVLWKAALLFSGLALAIAVVLYGARVARRRLAASD